jgi:hypothetical protein
VNEKGGVTHEKLTNDRGMYKAICVLGPGEQPTALEKRALDKLNDPANALKYIVFFYVYFSFFFFFFFLVILKR